MRTGGYRPGQHWITCQVCGQVYRPKDTRRRWDGAIVCKWDYETRHPQEFVRATKDTFAAQGLVNPEPTDKFVTWTCTTRSAIAGMAIVGCAIAGNTEGAALPSGTF